MARPRSTPLVEHSSQGGVGSASTVPDSPKRRSRSSSPGIVVRHTKRCASRDGGDCSCRPSFQAQAWSARDRKPVRKTFPTLAQAKGWRQEAQVGLRRGTLNAPVKVTVREAAEQWLDEAERGVVRTRSGDRYKPSALRSYRQVLQRTVIPEFGHLRLSALTRSRLQDLVDRMVGDGLGPSTIRNTFLPLRALYRRALLQGLVVQNPTLGLCLPAHRPKRDRVARPAEAEALLRALPDTDRALWATALYAGLRRGELQALRWGDVNLEQGVLRVEHSWDHIAGLIAPKSRAGRRTVPVPEALRGHLVAHRRAHRSTEFVFEGSAGRPMGSAMASRRAHDAWKKLGLRPIGLHECRHTYASLMIAAGVNAKALSTYMGHSSITVTLDRYGHLMPGNEREAGALLDAYLRTEGGASHAGKAIALAA